jgi:hypothetical protein
MNYQTELTVTSKRYPDVTFTILRMSFGRRLELVKRVRDLSRQLEFFRAGAEAQERVESVALAGEIDRLYLDWGLLRVNGLDLNGEPASTETLIASGPEELCREILAAIRNECGLSEQQRKN